MRGRQEGRNQRTSVHLASQWTSSCVGKARHHAGQWTLGKRLPMSTSGLMAAREEEGRPLGLEAGLLSCSSNRVELAPRTQQPSQFGALPNRSLRGQGCLLPTEASGGGLSGSVPAIVLGTCPTVWLSNFLSSGTGLLSRLLPCWSVIRVIVGSRHHPWPRAAFSVPSLNPVLG